MEQWKKSYAQFFQDLFVLHVNDNQPGFWVEVGCGRPDSGSTTRLLWENGWRGISIDVEYDRRWEMMKGVQYHCMDATDKGFMDIAMKSAPAIIDYLQLDIDDYTLNALLALDLDAYKFKCVTIEHDEYDPGRPRQKASQRSIMAHYGYELLVPDFGPDPGHIFEDWYVNPSLVDVDKLASFRDLSNFPHSPDAATPLDGVADHFGRVIGMGVKRVAPPDLYSWLEANPEFCSVK